MLRILSRFLILAFILLGCSTVPTENEFLLAVDQSNYYEVVKSLNIEPSEVLFIKEHIIVKYKVGNKTKILYFNDRTKQLVRMVTKYE